MRTFIGRGLAVILLAGSGMVAAGAAANASSDVAAFGIEVSLAHVGHAGPVPLANAAKTSASLASISAGPVSSGTLTAMIKQTSTSEKAAASVRKLSVEAPGLKIDGSAISATCQGEKGKTTTGSVTLAGLSVAGLPIPANPKPNTTLALPFGVGSLTLNAQSPAGPGGGLTVAALRIRLSPAIDGGGQIVVAQTTCGPVAQAVRHHHVNVHRHRHGKRGADGHERVNGTTMITTWPRPGGKLHVTNGTGVTLCSTVVPGDTTWRCTPGRMLPRGWNTLYLKNSKDMTLATFRTYVTYAFGG